jgi:hypothetical protein
MLFPSITRLSYLSGRTQRFQSPGDSQFSVEICNLESKKLMFEKVRLA